MGLLEIIFIAIGLAMDAFAVAICQGLQLKENRKRAKWRIASYFGSFQAIMPLIGYILGNTFQSFVTHVSHLIAFLLLSFIGINMLHDAKNHKEEKYDFLDTKTLLLLAIATSIDALAVGITFAFFSTHIYIDILIIGSITFLLSLIGVKIGNQFGDKLHEKAEFWGGIILLLMGIKMLLEHLGILGMS